MQPGQGRHSEHRSKPPWHDLMGEEYDLIVIGLIDAHAMSRARLQAAAVCARC